MARSVLVLCDLLFVMASICCSRSCNLWTAFTTCSSGACSVGVGSGGDESAQSPLHSQPSHQPVELPPLMGAHGRQWVVARGQKEAERCWCGRVAEWVRVMNVCKVLPSVPTVGPVLWVDPVGLRSARNKSQRLFTSGRRLEDVVTDSCRGILLPFGLLMLEMGRWESKWCSRHNRGHWWLSSRCRCAWAPPIVLFCMG